MVVQLSRRKWALYSHKGDLLGTHPSQAAAARQERAIHISKARAAGHKIPRRPARRSSRSGSR